SALRRTPQLRHRVPDCGEHDEGHDGPYDALAGGDVRLNCQQQAQYADDGGDDDEALFEEGRDTARRCLRASRSGRKLRLVSWLGRREHDPRMLTGADGVAFRDDVAHGGGTPLRLTGALDLDTPFGVLVAAELHDGHVADRFGVLLDAHVSP